MKISTLEIESIVINNINIRTHLVVPNVSWGIQYRHKPLHECDILSLTSSGYATEYEIKTSKADLLADMKKAHAHDHILIKYLYYVVPDHLESIAINNISDSAGLYVIVQHDNYKEFKLVKMATKRNDALKWTDALCLQLARLGTMRIGKLKNMILNYKYRLDDCEKLDK